MKFLPLIAANLFRRKVRTTLTIGSFAVALFLFCLLITIRAAFNQGLEVAGADRLMVISRVSIIQSLPLAHRDRILRVPGVKEMTSANWFGGVYQDEKNFFPQFAIDPETWLTIYNEFRVPGDQWADFLTDRTGVVVGQTIADRFEWKVGDRIPIKGAIYPGNWEFTLRGIYTGTRPQDDLTQMWFHWKYLDEKVPEFMKSRVGWYVVRVAPGTDPVRLTAAIDEVFANSPAETRTQTESAMMASFVEQMGNINLLMLAIGSVVVFTLLLVTGNTMATAVRERSGELAVLKAVGYPDAFVMWLVLAESTLIAMIGGGLGVLLAKLFTLRGDPTGGMFASFYLSPQAIAAALTTALLVGIVAGLIPAWSALRLQVVAALRKA